MIVLQPLSLRPRRWPAFIPGVAALFFLAFVPLPAKEAFYIFLIGMVAVSALMWWGFSKARLDVDQYSITQATLFFTRQINWTDLSQTYIRYEQHGKSGGLYWLFIPATGKTIKISVGMYNRASLRQLAEAVVNYSPFPVSDERVKNMSEGRFPWYVF